MTQERRASLVGAATDYVLQHGVADLTLRPLAAAIGTSDRMLVYHFGSKDALVDAVLEESNERLLALLRDRADRPPVPRRPGAVVARYWRLIDDPILAPQLRLWLEVDALAMRDPGRYRDVMRRTTSPWVDLVAGLLVGAGVPARRSRPLARLVVDALDGLMLDAITTADRAPVEAAVRELARLVDATVAA